MKYLSNQVSQEPGAEIRPDLCLTDQQMRQLRSGKMEALTVVCKKTCGCLKLVPIKGEDTVTIRGFLEESNSQVGVFRCRAVDCFISCAY